VPRIKQQVLPPTVLPVVLFVIGCIATVHNPVFGLLTAAVVAVKLARMPCPAQVRRAKATERRELWGL
jgi:hypothetical protein